MARLLTLARGARSAVVLPIVFAAYAVLACTGAVVVWLLIRSLLQL